MLKCIIFIVSHISLIALITSFEYIQSNIIHKFQCLSTYQQFPQSFYQQMNYIWGKDLAEMYFGGNSSFKISQIKPGCLKFSTWFFRNSLKRRLQILISWCSRSRSCRCRRYKDRSRIFFGNNELGSSVKYSFEQVHRSSNTYTYILVHKNTLKCYSKIALDFLYAENIFSFWQIWRIGHNVFALFLIYKMMVS